MTRTPFLLVLATIAMVSLGGCSDRSESPTPRYATNGKAAYWYGMTVNLKLKRCLEKELNLRWLTALEEYYWEHDIPEWCSDIRTLAETLKPKEED